MKYLKFFEDEEPWKRMTPRELSAKIDEIFALKDFDKITAAFQKIKDSHSYIQHPPWRNLWDEAMLKFSEMSKEEAPMDDIVDWVTDTNKPQEEDKAQPMRDYLASIDFKSPFQERLLSEVPLTDIELDKIIKATSSKIKSDIFNSTIIIKLLLTYHKEELDVEVINVPIPDPEKPGKMKQKAMWVGKCESFMNKWYDALMKAFEEDDKSDEMYDPRLDILNGSFQKIEGIYFQTHDSGPRTKMEQDIAKHGLFFKHRFAAKNKLIAEVGETVECINDLGIKTETDWKIKEGDQYTVTNLEENGTLTFYELEEDPEKVWWNSKRFKIIEKEENFDKKGFENNLRGLVGLPPKQDSDNVIPTK